MRKSNWAKLKWPRVKETASPAPLWLFCDPFCKSRAQSTCEGELIQKKTQVATIFQCTEAHQTFRSRLWVLTKLVSVSETNPNKKQILRRAMLVYFRLQSEIIALWSLITAASFGPRRRRRAVENRETLERFHIKNSISVDNEMLGEPKKCSQNREEVCDER